MPTNNRMERMASGTMALCAIAMTILVARREIGPTTGRDPVSVANHPVENWQRISGEGRRFGAVDAPVTLVEFADFQCPVCGRFSRSALRGARAVFGDSLAIVFRHWPLPYHPFASPAARASECAAAQGRFMEFADTLFAHQEDLGRTSFTDFAEVAGVPDTGAFATCSRETGSIASIERDTKAALGLKGRGTPTIIVNGEMLGGVPDSLQLDQIVRQALAEARKR